jgi:hypothetical protein
MADRTARNGRGRGSGPAAVFVALASLALALLGLTGCDLTASGPLSTAPVSAPATATAAASYPSAIPSNPTSICPNCPSAAGTQVVPGKVVLRSGVQVLEVHVVGETYTPNYFTVEAGVPVTVTFTGTARGCMKTPTFASLGKTGDVSTGSGSVELGPLKPGTYGWASSLGIAPGTIVAK